MRYLCPCGCKREVPNGCHYATPKCGKRYRYQMEKIGGNSHPCWTGRTRLEKKSTRYLQITAAQAGD